MTDALVHVVLDRCPACAEPLAREHVAQPAIVRTGGYGATRLSVTAWCPACGWWVLTEVGERRP